MEETAITAPPRAKQGFHLTREQVFFLFLAAAAALLVYGLLYARFRIQKGGLTAALAVLILVLLDTVLLALVVYFRTRT